MKEHIKKLKLLGMKPNEAIQFVREIAKVWYNMGIVQSDKPITFDTEFSKQLGN